MVIDRPSLAVVQRARSGQPAHAAPKVKTEGVSVSQPWVSRLWRDNGLQP
jgi:hypothetical protein